jgi:ABC-type Fe3+-hydroxamate transport system substrate-binding protein
MVDWKHLAEVLGWALAATLAALFIASRLGEAPLSAEETAQEERIVSLSPAITESLFAIGAGDAIVGRTDYCHFPEAAGTIPTVGAGLSPDLEAIARMQPTLILADGGLGADTSQLGQIAPTHALPWLSLDDLEESLSQLGTLTGEVDAATNLAENLQKALSVRPPDNAPRVLLLMGIDPQEQSLWFVHRQSLHGLALHAAGARNAVDEDVSGNPSISIERLLELDPDIIIGMASESNVSPEAVQAFEDRFAKLPTLSAAQGGHIAIIAGPEQFSVGPLLLELIDSLRDAIAESTPTP